MSDLRISQRYCGRTTSSGMRRCKVVWVSHDVSENQLGQKGSSLLYGISYVGVGDDGKGKRGCWANRRDSHKKRAEPMWVGCVKCTLVQALRLCTGRTAHRESRGIALLFHDFHDFHVWRVVGNIAPTGIRSPDRPARSQSLYRLRYQPTLAVGSSWNVMAYGDAREGK